MRIPRIYTPQPLATGSQLQLEPQASLHLAKVLRLQIGHPLTLFNGSGGEYAATIEEVNKKHLSVTIGEFNSENLQSSLSCDITVALSKGDKMDLIVQKCTELGAHSISPIITERSDVKLNQERREKKQQHWLQIAISACEQSGRNLLPIINPIQSFTDWLDQEKSGPCCIFHPGGTENFQALQTVEQLTICFGSEGGFSQQEIEYAGKKGCHIIGLGSRVLRAETAPISALSIAQAKWGDLQ